MIAAQDREGQRQRDRRLCRGEASLAHDGADRRRPHGLERDDGFGAVGHQRDLVARAQPQHGRDLTRLRPGQRHAVGAQRLGWDEETMH